MPVQDTPRGQNIGDLQLAPIVWHSASYRNSMGLIGTSSVNLEMQGKAWSFPVENWLIISALFEEIKPTNVLVTTC